MLNETDTKKNHTIIFNKIWEELKADMALEPEQITDDYWGKMINRYMDIVRQFHGTEYDGFVKSFVMAVVTEVERINTIKWKSNQNS